MAKLIYIGGYGRSGSTLLEYLLSASGAVVACGEVTRHFQRFGKVKTCTCGRQACDCPVWAPFQDRSGKLQEWNHPMLTMALLLQNSAEYAAMVDASKTAWGSSHVPFRLRKLIGQDVLFIHLMRDPRAVCWSTIRTQARHGETGFQALPWMRCLRTSVGWNFANLAAELFGWRYRDHYVRLRYETLAGGPEQVIADILRRLSLPPPNDLLASSGKDNRHQLYGNSMRFSAISEIKEDAAWKSEMSPWLKRLTWVLCGPLASSYGYKSENRL